MAQMNEFFMKKVQQNILDIHKRTGLSKYKFCNVLDISPTFMSALDKPEKWKTIPAWVWFLFQEVVNRRIEFNKEGRIIFIHDGYTLEEVHEHCRSKASGMTYVGKNEISIKKTTEGYNVKDPLELLDELIDILTEDISHRDRVYMLLDLKAKIQAWKIKQ